MANKNTFNIDKTIGYTVGILFLCILLGLVMFIPHPTELQIKVINTVLALAAGGFAMLISGTIKVEIPGYIRAGGALAITVLVLIGNPVKDISGDGKIQNWRNMHIDDVKISNSDLPGQVHIEANGAVDIDGENMGFVVTDIKYSFNKESDSNVRILWSRLFLVCKGDKNSYEDVSGSRVSIDRELKPGETSSDRGLYYNLQNKGMQSKVNLRDCIISLRFTIEREKQAGGYIPVSSENVF